MAIALKSNALITADELEALLQTTIASSDTKNMLINIASDLIDTFTNRTIAETTYTKEIYDADDGYYLQLKNYPISTTADLIVYEWDTINNAEAEELTIYSDYVTYYNEGILYGRHKWKSGPRVWRVTYTGGYAIANVPWDLKNAAAQIAGIYYYQKGKAGVGSETIGQYSVTYDKSGFADLGVPVPPEIMAVVNKYRKQNV